MYPGCVHAVHVAVNYVGHGVGAASRGSVAVPGPRTLLVTINYLPMMSSAHAVLGCCCAELGSLRKGNILIYIFEYTNEAMEGAVTAPRRLRHQQQQNILFGPGLPGSSAQYAKLLLSVKLP